jgi:hypothetical protein
MISMGYKKFFLIKFKKKERYKRENRKSVQCS